MLDRMSSKELASWMAYHTLEPWGEERADLRNGVLCCLIANLFRKKGKPPFKPEDFMPKFWKEKPDPEMMLQKVRQLNAMFGGVDKTDQKAAGESG